MFIRIIIFLILCSSHFINAKEYNVAFYSDFEPISYSEDRDSSSAQFNQAKGYEVDLLKAIEAMPDSEMTFTFHGVKEWNNIWLTPYTNPEIDIAMGGITREDRRLLNAEQKQVVATTHRTTQFKQSLLMRSDSTNINTHEDLNCSYVIGAVRGTTGEYRYLAQSNIISNIDDGFILEGITVVLENKEYIISDGSLSIYDPRIETRTMLLPFYCTFPITKYFIAEDSMIPALKDGYIDGIARGYIGNKLVADNSNGEFVVKAIYSLECPRQESISCSLKEEAVFFIKLEDQKLLNKLNLYIDYLTDHGLVDYDDWKLNKNIFMERAMLIQNLR